MQVRAIRTTPKRGLVVVPEVCTEAIELAVQGLWDEGYFHLSSVNPNELTTGPA